MWNDLDTDLSFEIYLSDKCFGLSGALSKCFEHLSIEIRARNSQPRVSRLAVPHEQQPS